ncbi:MAG: DUF2779 domain-containing protein, partial [Clostridia bacterium]|nr:DUF2779 domain-containing protein [Clostridia bacterium]
FVVNLLKYTTMITKSIIKDFVHRKCPYLAKASLDDNTLLKLIESYLEFGTKEDFEDMLDDGQDAEDNPSEDKTFDILEIMQDYPHLRGDIEKLIIKHAQENPLYGLLKKYEDTQVTSRLSRRYIEMIYGKENCKRCDVNDFGVETSNQKFILEKTKQYLADENVKVIFEGQIEHLDLRARFDILIKEDDGTYTLIEAKGSNSAFTKAKDPLVDTGIKVPYLFDLLFQYYIYVKEGLNISRLGYLHLNKEFTYSKNNESYPNLCDEDVKNLFSISYSLNMKVGKEEYEEVPIITYLDSESYVKTNKDGSFKVPPILEVITEIRNIATMFEVNPNKHYECVKGGKCPFLVACFDDAEDPNSTMKLTRWGNFGGSWARSKRLIDNGIHKISEIPTEIVGEYEEEKEKDGVTKYCNARTQIKFQNEWKNKGFSYVIHEDLMNSILHRDYLNNDIDYLVFFDFESIQNPVPLMKDAHPWQQVVTQYSMHIVGRGYDLTKHDFAKGRGGNCSHYEFIGHPSKDGCTNPEFELFKTLRDQLEDFGISPMAKNYRVVVFNQNFEKTRMNEFVRLYASHEDVDADLVNFVQNFNDNVVDLLDFFTSGSFYGSNFNGRGSLKVVQPTLCEDEDVNKYYESIGLPFDFKYSLDYHKKGALVYNGGICLDLYKALLVRNHVDPSDNDPDENEMLAQALAYCKIDSWGTVIIYDVIKHVSDGKIKLKALMLK